MWVFLCIGAFFLAMALIPLATGRAFTEIASYVNPDRYPSAVTRRKMPFHYWFFVVFNFVMALFFLGSALLQMSGN